MRKVQKNGKRIVALVLSLLIVFTSCMTEELMVQAAPKKPVKITLDRKQASMSVGGTMKLKVKSVSPKGASKSVKWKSSNKKIATVSGSGKVKAKKNGTVTITAISKANAKATAKCKIKVYKATKKLQLKSRKSYSLNVGKTVTLKVTTTPKKGVQPVQWSSKNKKVAKVNSKGKVTAVSAGQTSIIGKSGKKKVSVTIKVKKADSTTPEKPTPEEPTPEDPTPEEPTPEEPTPSVGDYSRAEWIAQLVDRMGYFITEESLEKDAETGEYIYSYDDISENEYAWKIEAAVQNGILPIEEDANGERNYLFMPDKEAAREFAAMTAVHAAGFATDTVLDSSDYAELLYPAEDKAALDAEMMELKDGAFCPQEYITEKEAKKIFQVIDEILESRMIDSNHEDVVEYQDNVVVVEEPPEMADYTVDVSEEKQSLAVTLPETMAAEELQEGQILLLPSNKEYPEGMPIKIASVSSADGKAVVYGQLPEDMTEVFEKVDIEGVGYIDEEDVVLADGVRFLEEEGISTHELIDVGEGIAGFKKTLAIPLGSIETEGGVEAGAEVSLTLEIPKVNCKIDYEKNRVNEVFVSVPNTITAAFDAHAGWSGSKELLKKEILRTPVKLPAGFSVDLVITAVFSINGSIHIEYAIDTEFGMQYKNGQITKINKRNSKKPSMELDAEAKAGINITAEISWLAETRKKVSGFLSNLGINAGGLDDPIYTLGTEVGVGVHAKTTVRKVVCTDASLWLYWDIFVGEGDNLLAAILPILSHRWEIFNEDDSPVKLSGHFENLKKVDKCTQEEAGKSKIAITVTSLKKEPLEGVSLTLRADTGNKKYITDASGQVKLELSNGVYKCTAAKAGYKTLTKNVTVESGKLVTVPIVLAEEGSAEKGDISTSVEDFETEGDGSETGGDGSETGESKPVILESGTWHGLTWSLDENYHMVVQGTPEISSWSVGELDKWSGAPWKKDGVLSADFSGMDTENVYDMGRMFLGCSSLTSLDISNFDTGNVTNMRLMFSGCSSLTSLDLSNFDTGMVGNMTWMFEDCNSLKSLDLSNFDTGYVGSMRGMFEDCSNLTSLNMSGWYTRSENMESMFSGCSSLTSLDISSFDTGSVKYMGNMFYGCSSLTSLDLSSFDTGNVTDMRYMFGECSSLTSLDISNFDTGNVTNMRYMFGGCSSLTSLDISSFTINNEYSDEEFILTDRLITIKVPRMCKYGRIYLYGKFKDNEGNIYEHLPVTDGTSFEITRVVE